MSNINVHVFEVRAMGYNKRIVNWNTQIEREKHIKHTVHVFQLHAMGYNKRVVVNWHKEVELQR